MGKKRTFVNPENPESLLKMRLGKVSDAAAGVTGVKVAVQHVFSEMGPARGLKALFNLNQKAVWIVRVVHGPIPMTIDR